MHLNGDFTHTERAGNLLVHQTDADETDHLLLAYRQRLETRLQFGNGPLLVAPGAVQGQAALHRIKQLLVTERLGQKLDGSRLHGPDGHWDVAVTGDEDDGNPGVRLG